MNLILFLSRLVGALGCVAHTQSARTLCDRALMN
jgi:hypothetical protein